MCYNTVFDDKRWIMINFKSISKHDNENYVYINVLNPLRSDEYAWCEDYNFLKNSLVKIDDIVYKVLGVEMYMYAGKRRDADPITLKVERINF